MSKKKKKDIPLSGIPITGLGTPTPPGDAVTKKYVDSLHGMFLREVPPNSVKFITEKKKDKKKE